MVETLTVIYLAYMFITLYFLFLFTLTFAQNRKEIFAVPEITKNYSVSILVPAYNEERSIRGTVESILRTDYKNLVEVIIINDGSSDSTLRIARELEKKYSKVKVLNKQNSGKADSLNKALEMANGELIGVVDADSYPDSHAIRSMVGFFDDSKVGGVTTRILVKNRSNFLARMQSIEYKVIAFTRKLLEFLDSIYVTPGPLALYRKTALVRIGGFDRKNMTEDIEVVWNLVHHDYVVKMSFVAKSTTVAPETIEKWLKQRIRWNIGGYQTILKYKSSFFRKNMLGYFILPFFSIALVLGVFGLGILVYRVSRRILYSYLSTRYSIVAETALLRMNDVNLNPSILNFLGVILFVVGLWFVFLALRHINNHIHEKESFFSVIFYSLIYIMLRPIVLVVSLVKFLTGKYSWR
ncbi:glycosyltransferase [Candidatus Pacearchaeota archaeon]|nr:glycosyltransferase [Candidatus Pacearchaeota archaeon]